MAFDDSNRWGVGTTGDPDRRSGAQVLKSQGKSGRKESKARAKLKEDKFKAMAAGSIYRGSTSPGDRWKQVGYGSGTSTRTHKGGVKSYRSTKVPLWQKSPGQGDPNDNKKKDSKKKSAYSPSSSPEVSAAERSGTAAVDNKPAPERPKYNEGNPIEAPVYDQATAGAGNFLSIPPGQAPTRALDYAGALTTYNDLTAKDLALRARDNKAQTERHFTGMARVLPEAPDDDSLSSYDRVLDKLKKAKGIFA